MGNKVLVYIDQIKGDVLPTSWETLGAGQMLAEKLGGEVSVLIVGKGADAVAAQAFQYGAIEVLYADDPTLDDFRAEPYTSLIASVAKEQSPEVILFPTTTRGRELAAMSSIDLQTGVLADVTFLDVEDDKVVAIRPVYAGKLLSRVFCEAKPQIITTRVRAFEKPSMDVSRTGSPKQVAAPVTEDAILTKVVDTVQGEKGVSLTDAGVIVSGGRGVANNPKLQPPGDLDEKEAEIWRAHQGFQLVGELAKALGGAVGASRAAVDAGYIPYSHQVGQTGKVVTPDLYIACGISGAIQHLAGMRNSKVIVAINKDADAPIFKLARFGVVADLHEILPALTEAFQERLGS